MLSIERRCRRGAPIAICRPLLLPFFKQPLLSRTAANAGAFRAVTSQCYSFFEPDASTLGSGLGYVVVLPVLAVTPANGRGALDSSCA